EPGNGYIFGGCDGRVLHRHWAHPAGAERNRPRDPSDVMSTHRQEPLENRRSHALLPLTALEDGGHARAGGSAPDLRGSSRSQAGLARVGRPTLPDPESMPGPGSLRSSEAGNLDAAICNIKAASVSTRIDPVPTSRLSIGSSFMSTARKRVIAVMAT